MPFYKAGAFGRALFLLLVAMLVLASDALAPAVAIGGFFVLWAAYAFVGGIVAVPYNDIVARAVAPAHRSRLLALRFFGGGLLALGVAAAAHWLLERLAFPFDYAAILLIGAGLLLASAIAFVFAGEPDAPAPQSISGGFGAFAREGLRVLRADTRFQIFLYSRWLEGAATMALPFYVVAAMASGISPSAIAFLLAAQTAGALLSNPLWGWWGDYLGKRRLLEVTAALGLVAPTLALAWSIAGGAVSATAVSWFAAMFFVLGAVGNGSTIAQLGYLMEISPDDRRPAYSGYFNALVAPAALLPLAGAAVIEMSGLPTLFALAAAAAALQWFAVRKLRVTAHRAVTA